MTTIDDLHQFILLIANKNGVGYLSPIQRNRAVNHAELQLFNDRMGKPALYQPGRPVPPVAYAVTQKVEDDLAPFLVTARFTPTAQVPHWPKPVNFLHPIPGGLTATYQPARGWDVAASAALPAVTLTEVEVLTRAELAQRRASTLNPPSAAVPVASFSATELECYPLAALLSVSVPYLRAQVFSRWVGSVPAGGTRLAYDPTLSTPTEWLQDTWNELAMRALAYLGIHLSAPQVAQYAEQKTLQG